MKNNPTFSNYVNHDDLSNEISRKITDLDFNDFRQHLLIFSPPSFIKRDAKRYKQWLTEIIGGYDAYYSQAHMTVASFYLHSKHLNRLIKYLEYATSLLKPQIFTIDNFDKFEFKDADGNFNGTLFSLIKQFEEFAQITRNINEKALRHINCSNKRLTYIPHITIGTGLSVEELEKAFKIFSQEIYRQTFISANLTLLKRNSIGIYEELREFPLLSQTSPQLSITF